MGSPRTTNELLPLPAYIYLILRSRYSRLSRSLSQLLRLALTTNSQNGFSKKWLLFKKLLRNFKDSIFFLVFPLLHVYISQTSVSPSYVLLGFRVGFVHCFQDLCLTYTECLLELSARKGICLVSVCITMLPICLHLAIARD